MSRRPMRVHEFMRDISQACEHIEQFTAGATEADFLANVMMQYSVYHALEVMGEASKLVLEALPDAVLRFKTLPLKEMYATRNRLIHGYATVKAETIWNIVVQLLPPVHASMKSILANWPADLD